MMIAFCAIFVPSSSLRPFPKASDTKAVGIKLHKLGYLNVPMCSRRAK